MKMNFTEELLWEALFLALLPAYILYYAPYGINETDGGFLSGLAWQVLQGKTLYHDIIYVRPPLPVWLRALEIKMLPLEWSVLGERWIFYLTVWTYSLAGASLLGNPGKKRWMLAAFSFVVSVHCYPAMAWHTTDGIFFAVLAAWCLWRRSNGWWLPLSGGLALFAALMCKQSFYPLPFLFALSIMLDKSLQKRQILAFAAGFTVAAGIFGIYLIQYNLRTGFLEMTGGASGISEAIQHGMVDYFRINPALAIPSMVWIVLIIRELRRKSSGSYAPGMFALWLVALACSFGLVIWHRQEHTVPFAQSRALFWVAGAWVLFRIWQERHGPRTRRTAASLVLLGITWCAALSWGFNLPLLFSTPWVWAAMESGEKLCDYCGTNRRLRGRFALLFLLLLLGVFRLGYDFIYRDGRRGDMTVALGDIFPRLHGIYSDSATAERYTELKTLVQQYGNNFAVLPAFTQSHFLTNAYPPLPLDWVVNRETNGHNELIMNCLYHNKPVVFIENEAIEKCRRDPELSLTRWVLDSTEFLEKRAAFSVFQLKSK